MYSFHLETQFLGEQYPSVLSVEGTRKRQNGGAKSPNKKKKFDSNAKKTGKICTFPGK